MDQLCGFKALNLRLSSSFIDKVKVEIPIIDFLSRPHIHVKANSLYATMSMKEAGSQKQKVVAVTQEVKKEEKKVVPSSMSSDLGSKFQQELIGNSQEDTILESLKQKIAKNINVELKKAKIILFSDITTGQQFDIVLKIKNLHIINNKQSPFVDQVRNLKVDQGGEAQDQEDFEGCETVSHT